MRIINISHNENLNYIGDLSVVIGNFNSLHLGHQELLNELSSFDNEKAIITFTPHPLEFFTGKKVYYLNNLEQTKNLIKQYNINLIINIKFDLKLSKLSNQEFSTMLTQLGVKNIIIGEDFRFGDQKKYTYKDLLKPLNVFAIKNKSYKYAKISSSSISKNIKNGDIDDIEMYLGRRFSIRGKVIKGRQLGRTIGYKTANIEYLNYILPKKGVYYGKCIVDTISYKCMINIGYNPTVTNMKLISLETHIFNFNEDIYGEEIEIYFYSKLRDEIKFPSLDHLKEQLKKDEDYILSLDY